MGLLRDKATLFEAKLTHADDRIRLSDWLPPQWGGMPHIRFGKRWFNIWWLLPLGFLCLLIGVAVAQELRQIPAVQAFLVRYPGHTVVPVQWYGFPLWMRCMHFFNLFLMFLIIRAGIQILADHPRLYWNVNCTPGTEWFRFQHSVPTGRIWTAKDDAVTLPGWLGIPGIRHSIGLARWWHFSFDFLWVLTGVSFYALLFATGQWRKLVPVNWSVFTNAISAAIHYGSLNLPAPSGWTQYNGLQILSYFVIVFIAAPLMLITGLLQAPAIASKFGLGWGRINRQTARIVHFTGLVTFVGFIFIHTVMVWITGVLVNLNHITTGWNTPSWTGWWLYVAWMAIVVAAWWAATPLTLRYPRAVQRTGAFLIGWLKGLAEFTDPGATYPEKAISPFFWPNQNRLPDSEEYKKLRENGFRDYVLRIDGLVANPVTLTYEQLKAIPKTEQITQHYCIQGWSGIAKWGGVPMDEIVKLVQPLPEARFAVFYSFSEGPEGGLYYDAHKVAHMSHHLTILAYEMNGKPLNELHGAPLRLRNELELGFKMVKWVQAIEFVESFAHLGAGQGGYNEDHEYFGYRMPI